MCADVWKAKGSSRSPRVLIRYVVLQIPATALVVVVLVVIRRWLDLPSWFFWSLIVLWVVKDVVLYPFVWRSYDPDSSEEENSMVGELGVAEDRLDPSGYVQLRGELWKAEVVGGGTSVRRGERVRVREVKGLTLLVQRENEDKT